MGVLMSLIARSRALWRLPRAAVPMFVLALGLMFVPTAAAASPVIVQGTTDVRDAGLLHDVIEPGFAAAYPQYELKYIAVGTGVAIAAAEAGQGDALLVHAPSNEKPFVEKGFSLEPRGRALFYSDYVIPGPLDDPAEVATKAPHNAALAYELIAKAGNEGKANFVSRGDKSGTNTQELAIWKLTGVELNKLGEPGPAGTETDAPWYHKANLGQAETLKLASECPAIVGGVGCYEMTDRGTYNHNVANGAVTNMQIVTQNNEASAPGGSNLLVNPFTFYVVNPAKVPNVSINVEGAKALMEYLTSEAFQAQLANYPSGGPPAFFADARPKLTSSSVNGDFDSGAKFSLSGTIDSLLPGAQPVSGVPVNVQEAPFGRPSSYTTIGTGTTGADGSYSIGATATRAGTLRVEMPNTDAAYPSLAVTPLISSGGLTQTFVPAGQISNVRPLPPPPLKKGTVGLKKPTTKGRVVTLNGTVSPAVSPSSSAVLVIQGRKLGTKQKFHRLKKVRAREGVAYKLSVKLKAGKWKLRVRYQDPGVITAPVASRAVSVSVR
jgi:tungstate transport system substrate-binding protein